MYIDIHTSIYMYIYIYIYIYINVCISIHMNINPATSDPQALTAATTAGTGGCMPRRARARALR